MFNPVEIIRAKRNKEEIPGELLSQFIMEFAKSNIPDYQMTAFMMAVYFQGMNLAEMRSLVHAMRGSGNQLDLSGISGAKLDKHSTGGVGDKISLVLAPLLAGMDLVVPMISGRGLGHSGGTLDKLESIPGLKTEIPLSKIRELIKRNGFVIAGQTNELVPADRKMYALRDTTATVESLPLVVGSIMSKKLSEDLDGLILDIKTGKGSFFPNEKDARQLAKLLINVGEEFGVKTRALLTNMNTPIGYAVGNWLEVYESIECLNGNGPQDTMELVYSLAIVALQLSGDSRPVDNILVDLQEAISNGVAMEKFKNYVNEVGGDVRCIENYQDYELPASVDVLASKHGYIAALDAYEIGVATNMAGAGRLKTSDTVDPTAGILLNKKVGEKVEKSEPIASLYTRKNNKMEIQDKIEKAFVIQDRSDGFGELVYGEVNREGKLIPFISPNRPKK